jgi:hypothetical protein
MQGSFNSEDVFYIRPYFENLQYSKKAESETGPGADRVHNVQRVPISTLHLSHFSDYDPDNNQPRILANVPITITTLSSSRIDYDEVDQKDEESDVNAEETRSIDTFFSDYEVAGSAQSSSSAARFPYRELLSSSTAKDDFEFSYDYETYMFQVTNNNSANAYTASEEDPPESETASCSDYDQLTFGSNRKII